MCDFPLRKTRTSRKSKNQVVRTFQDHRPIVDDQINSVAKTENIKAIVCLHAKGETPRTFDRLGREFKRFEYDVLTPPMQGDTDLQVRTVKKWVDGWTAKAKSTQPVGINIVASGNAAATAVKYVEQAQSEASTDSQIKGLLFLGVEYRHVDISQLQSPKPHLYAIIPEKRVAKSDSKPLCAIQGERPISGSTPHSLLHEKETYDVIQQFFASANRSSN